MENKSISKEKIFFCIAYQFFYKKSDVSFRKNIVDSTKNQNGKRNCQIQIATTDDEDMNSSGYVSDSAPAESESDDFESLI